MAKRLAKGGIAAKLTRIAANALEPMPKSGQTGRVPSQNEILDRVRALTPGFAGRARAAEDARRLPDESVAEMVAAGLPRILIPRSRGGYGHRLETWFEAVREISKADASHGWCASLMVHHPHYLSQCTAEAQDAVWAEGPDAVIGASFAPTAEIVPANGGFLVSGRSAFTSGIAHSGWVFIGGLDPTCDPAEWSFFLVPPGSYDVEDTWFTAGMRATGSNTVVTDRVFVPASYTVRLSDMREGKGPGAKLHDGAIYRAPFIAYAPITFVTPMLGAAQGAYEHFRDWTRSRTGVRGNAVAAFTSIQVRLWIVAGDEIVLKFPVIQFLANPKVTEVVTISRIT